MFLNTMDTSEYIKTYINNFESSSKRKEMVNGEAYYRSKNIAILDRNMWIYTEENGIPIKIKDPYKANNKLPSGYMKILVNQKLNYSVGKDIALKTIGDDDNAILLDILGKDFSKKLKQIGKEACKKSVGWGHVYINDNGEFKIKLIPSEQVIPIYSMYDDEVLEKIIRYYSVTTSNSNNEIIQVNRVEIWDKEMVTYYQQNSETLEYDLLNKEEMFNIFGRNYTNPKYHFQKDLKYGNVITTTEGLSWGEVPFVPLFNNDEEQTDLEGIKQFIDAYDIVNSDFINNLEEFQDIYWILKGYDGENIGEFLNQVKRYKTLKVAEDGDAKSEKIDIPYEARKEALQRLEEDIFKFGMGVNPDKIASGNITNVVIKARFANLDLKANDFEQEIKDFINKLMVFVNRYLELNNQANIELDNITFNRTLMMNMVELLDANVKQLGNVSKRTQLENNPYMIGKNIDEELKAIEEESGINLDDVE